MKVERVRFTLRVPETLMREVYSAKANQTLNDFICHCVEHYCEQLRRKEIDKQFMDMNALGMIEGSKR